MTASVTGSPRASSASRRSFSSTRAESSGGVKVLPPRVKVFGVPIHRLKEAAVSSGSVISCSLATAPTARLPSLSRHTTLGVRSSPSEFFTSSGLPSFQTQARELVVPRSIPRIAMLTSYVFQSSPAVRGAFPLRVVIYSQTAAMTSATGISCKRVWTTARGTVTSPARTPDQRKAAR